MQIHDFKPFVPSNDFEISKSFYVALGFKISWESNDICEVDTQQGYRFLLTSKNHNNYAHSLMLHFMVDSADDWHKHFCENQLPAKFEGTKVAKPELMPWGLIVCHVWDPAGVLLHFAEKPLKENSE